MTLFNSLLLLLSTIRGWIYIRVCVVCNLDDIDNNNNIIHVQPRDGEYNIIPVLCTFFFYLERGGAWTQAQEPIARKPRKFCNYQLLVFLGPSDSGSVASFIVQCILHAIYNVIWLNNEGRASAHPPLLSECNPPTPMV